MVDTAVRRKVRPSSKPKSFWQRFGNFLKLFVLGANLRRLLVALAAVYVLVALDHWNEKIDAYGVLYRGDDAGAVRYALGAPASVEKKINRIWTYQPEATVIFTAVFDANGKLSKAACANRTGVVGSCPLLFDIGIGASEEAILGHLGLPSNVRIEGESKYITYAEIGATYVLQRFVVTGLRRDLHQGSSLGRTWRFIRSLFYLPGMIV